MLTIYALSEVSGMDAIVTDIGKLVTAGIGWISQFVTTITGSPLLLLFVITPFVGLGIGLIRRIIHT
jgi:hypothetical protein